MRYLITVIAAFAVAAAVFSSARADGILVPGPWPPPDPIVDIPPAFAVKYHHVDVRIEGQIARTHIDQVFKSDFHQDMEATYIFPIPEGAAIKEFNMWSGKEKLPGKILDAGEARRIYEQIVRHRKDPALLEYAGRGMFKARVFPVPAHGEKRIEIEYTEVLNKTNNIVKYTYPLNTEKFSTKPLETVRVSIEINSDIPIKNVYSPTHNLSIRQEKERRATASYEASNVTPNTDLTLYYTLSDDDIGLGLMTYKPDGEDGFFMFLASPRAEVQMKEVEAKDVVFVFDRTGSMSGEKIDQARQALKFCLRTLNPGDRFNVVPFNESPDPLFRGLQKATKENVSDAISAADSIDAMGGTNIDEALRKSIPMLDEKERPSFIVFLTDGLPTVGQTDVEEIIANVKKQAPKHVRVFVFGVGYDVNTDLLDRLAQNHHGQSEYVRPAEDIEVKVSGLFRMISYPILADLDVDFGGMKVYDVLPSEMPDLFKGSQVVLTGRYRGSGDAKIVLSGKASGKTHKFTLRQPLDRYAPLGDFIPVIWAQRKIGYLMTEIRRKGQQKELVDEVIRLSKKYGIITEYTSFLVQEPEFAVSSVPMGRVDEEARDRFLAHNEVRVAEKQGGSAVNQSVNMNTMLSKDKAAPMAEQMYFDADGNEVALNGVVNAGPRTFFQQGSNYVENTYVKGQKVLNVKAYSEAYFQLIENDASLGKVLAVGDEVLFTVNGNAVQVGPSGEEKLSNEQIKQLFGKKKGGAAAPVEKRSGRSLYALLALPPVAVTSVFGVTRLRSKNRAA